MRRIVILDAGHGYDTEGKRSPVWEDGCQLVEWEFNRDIVNRIRQKCELERIRCEILTDELRDIPLSERARRTNEFCKEHRGAFLVSIHANAGGGTGWEVWTSPGQTESDEIATMFYNEMKKEFPHQRFRTDKSDGDVDKEERFYLLTKTTCPAILTENFFMDTESDCRLIMSDEGRERIAKAHFRAIKKIVYDEK